MTSNYTGIFVQRDSKGAVYNIQVVDQFGHETGFTLDLYQDREISPPVETLPDEAEYRKKR